MAEPGQQVRLLVEFRHPKMWRYLNMLLPRPLTHMLNDLEEQYPSRDLQIVLRHLDSFIDWGAPRATYEKAYVAPILRRLIGEEPLSQSLVIYNGASFDIEWPILTGAARITLIDPIFGWMQEEVEERRRGLCSALSTPGASDILVDRGSGKKEKIEILLEPVRGEDYQPPERISAILSYQLETPWLCFPAQLSALRVGGVIFQNVELQMWWGSSEEFERLRFSVWDEMPEPLDFITEATDPHDPLYRAWNEFVARWAPAWDENARKLGLERIVVPRWSEVMPPFGFYRKVEENEELIKLSHAYQQANNLSRRWALSGR